jgi:hypothetical protein
VILTIAQSAAITARADTARDLNEGGCWLEAQSLRLCRQSRVTMNDDASGIEPAASGCYPAFFTLFYPNRFALYLRSTKSPIAVTASSRTVVARRLAFRH